MQIFIKILHSIQEIKGLLYFFSDFGPRQRLDRWRMVFGKLFWLHLVNINIYAKFYQNIRTVQEFGSVSCFKINLTSAKPRSMINMSFGKTCRNQCVYQISSKYSKSAIYRARFNFSHF